MEVPVMATEKKALMCVFRPKNPKSTAEMRELFLGSYPRFRDMEGVEFKCWWCNQEAKEWGALYIFTSAETLEAYVNSDIWQKVVPEKYGCTPTWAIVDSGPILSKKTITEGQDSWVSA